MLFSFVCNLIGFVTLAGKQNHRAGCGKAQCRPDGFPAVGHADGLCPAGRGEAGAYFRHYVFRFLAAAVVCAHYDSVSILFGHRRHLGPFAAVAVASAAEQANQFPSGFNFAQGFKNVLQGIRGMGVVDNHRLR